MFLYLSPQKAFLFLSFIFSLFQAFRDLQIMGTAGANRCNDLLKTNLTGVPSSSFSLGAFHLDKISGPAVNGTRFVSSSHWKIPRKSGKSKKVGQFSRLDFPNGISCSIYTFLVVCTSPRSTARKTVGHRDVPGFTTKWNNFLPIGNSTFAPTQISSFFPNEKRPLSPYCFPLLPNFSPHSTISKTGTG